MMFEWSKIFVLILCAYCIAIGIMNTIAFSTATDGSCSGITKSYADVLMVLNIVLIFVSAIIGSLVFYQMLSQSGRTSTREKVVEMKSKSTEEKNIKTDKPRPVVDKMPVKNMDVYETRYTSQILDQPAVIDRELYSASAYSLV